MGGVDRETCRAVEVGRGVHPTVVEVGVQERRIDVRGVLQGEGVDGLDQVLLDEQRDDVVRRDDHVVTGAAGRESGQHRLIGVVVAQVHRDAGLFGEPGQQVLGYVVRPVVEVHLPADLLLGLLGGLGVAAGLLGLGGFAVGGRGRLCGCAVVAGCGRGGRRGRWLRLRYVRFVVRPARRGQQGQRQQDRRDQTSPEPIGGVAARGRSGIHGFSIHLCFLHLPVMYEAVRTAMVTTSRRVLTALINGLAPRRMRPNRKMGSVVEVGPATKAEIR